MKPICMIAIISALTISNFFQVSAKPYPIQKTFLKTDKSGGGCKINKMYIDAGDKQPSVNFDFSIEKANSYYISAWAFPINIEGEITTVYLDGVKIGVLKNTKKTWHSNQVKSEKNNEDLCRYITLGNHTVTFTSNKGIPRVEFIKMGETLEKSKIPENEYIARLNATITNNKQFPVNEYAKGKMPDAKSVTSQTEYATNSFSDDPQYSYYAVSNVPVRYTFFCYISVAAGAHVSIETSGNQDPVAYLFSLDLNKPLNFNNDCEYSYYNDDYSGMGYNSKIDRPMPGYDGVYCVLIKNYYNFSTTCGLTINNNGTVENIQDIMISGYTINLFEVDNFTNHAYQNFYTTTTIPDAKWSNDYDTKIWITNNDEVISGQNDDFYGMFDGYDRYYYRSTQDCNGLTYEWGYLSRLFGGNIFNNNAREFIISKFSSYNGDNTMVDAYASVDKIWDHYGCAKDGTPCFPYMQDGYGCQDAIGRDGGEPEKIYNCFAWAGGVTNVYFDPYRNDFPGNVWYVAGDPQATLDNWYGNTPARTSTAKPFTRTGANYDNSVLDVWKDDGDFFSHASVSKNANGHYHGYAWESKLGTTGKIMHDRRQLRRADYYGDVYEYYIPDESSQAISSTSFNGEIVETFEMDSVHRNKITKIISKAPNIAIQEIEMYYDKWKKYCDTSFIKYSSLRAPYLNNDFYDTLINACKKHGKNAMSILIKKFYEDDPYSTMPIYDMLPQYDPEKVIWNSFRTGSMHGKRSLDGKFIRETPRSNWGKYIQKIMDKNNF